MDELTDVRLDGQFVTLNELISILGEDDDTDIDVYNITALPPVNATDSVTDEDSGPEDSPTIDNLPGSQLRSLAVGGADKVPRPGPSGLNEASTSKASKMLPKTKKKTPKPKKKAKSKRKFKAAYCHKWKKEELNVGADEWVPVSTAHRELKTPREYFKFFFDEEVMNSIIVFTNQYAAKKNKLGDVSENEMWSFIAILLLSGYVDVPRRAMYWQKDEDAHNHLVANALSRDRFDFIIPNLHVCNNDKLKKNDRFAKVRPLIDLLNARFKDFAPHQQCHSVDEQMVPYFGRHGCKQFIRGKPIRFGYKFWAGGTNNGYIVWVEPYQGAGTCNNKYAGDGLGYSVVMSYADELPMKNMPYQLYFDNLFTSIRLLKDLKTRGILGTGTIRATAVPHSCPLSSVDIFKKTDRGSYESATDETTGVMIVRWNDNSVESAATSYDSVTPLNNVSRFSREKQRIITVNQPHLFLSYNTGMGGIDRADQNVSLYRISIRGKKWYFPLIAQMIDLAEHNAWQLYRNDGGKLDHLAFRRSIATSILVSNSRTILRKGRRSKKIVNDARFDGLEHFVAEMPMDTHSGKKKQVKCLNCNKKCTTMCTKYDRGLHVSCFIAYHTKP